MNEHFVPLISEIHPRKNTPFYRQEGKVGMYQIMLPFLVTGKPMLAYLPVNWGESYGMFKDNYAEFYFYEENFRRVAEETLKISDQDIPEAWRKDIAKYDTKLTSLSRALADADMSAFSDDELRERYDELFAIDQAMWAVLIFIDSFDCGVDQETIVRLQKVHNLSDDEAHVLLTPHVPAFVTSWELALTELKEKKRTRDTLRRDFFWYAIDYSHFRELSDEFIDSEISKGHEAVFYLPVSAQEEVLRTHHLKVNPLQFFQNLAVWRDERKRLNYTGLYGLMKILREVCRRQNIPAELVNGLLPQQVDGLFEGKVSKELLESQIKEGTFHYVSKDAEFSYAFGSEGERLWRECKTVVTESEKGRVEVKGMIASRGIARGMVRFIADPHAKENATMQEGDILITSMTRPEFLPYMKKAGAIVTDEGGISCHAAIVARELGKPCIIGTRNATKVLKSGDFVEVDAEKGIVKILSNSNV